MSEIDWIAFGELYSSTQREVFDFGIARSIRDLEGVIRVGDWKSLLFGVLEDWTKELKKREVSVSTWVRVVDFWLDLGLGGSVGVFIWRIAV